MMLLQVVQLQHLVSKVITAGIGSNHDVDECVVVGGGGADAIMSFV